MSIISVGDVISQNMTKNNIPVHILIVDNKVMREPITPISLEAEQTLRVKNPSGTLTLETWRILKEALRQKRKTRVLVDGEEDLLTLVAVLRAPENSFVVYGQPKEGVVVVKNTKQAKEKVRKIIEEMEPASEKLK